MERRIVPEGYVDKTGLSDVESMYDSKHRWKSGDLDEENAPLQISFIPGSYEKLTARAAQMAKNRTTGSRARNTIVSYHFMAIERTQWPTQTPLHSISKRLFINLALGCISSTILHPPFRP